MPVDEATDVNSPTWAGAAIAASEARFLQDFAEVRHGYLEEFEVERTERRKAAKRLYDYQRDRLEMQVGAAKAWLDARLEHDIDDKDRKIIPARRGRLEKDLSRLADLRAKHELKLDQIERDAPQVEAEIAWASVLVGT